MSTTSAANLQSTNSQLIKCIEDLRSRRVIISQEIQREEEEKAKIQHNLQILNEKLSRVNEQLKKKQEASIEFGRTLKETEGAYNVSLLLNAISILLSDEVLNIFTNKIMLQNVAD